MIQKFTTQINNQEFEVEYEAGINNRIKSISCNTLPLDLKILLLSEDQSHIDLVEFLKAAMYNNAASVAEDRNVRESNILGNIMSNAFSNF